MKKGEPLKLISLFQIFGAVENVSLKGESLKGERAWREWIDMSGETDLFNFEIWGFVFQVVVDNGETSERGKEEDQG